jgi:hypothetical protein
MRWKAAGLAVNVGEGAPVRSFKIHDSARGWEGRAEYQTAVPYSGRLVTGAIRVFSAAQEPQAMARDGAG